jgi:hypothetical protein
LEFDSNTFIVPTEPVQRQLKSFQYCEYDASRSPVGPTADWLYCGDWSGAMTKRTRLICWIVILFALVGGIVWWQLAKLSKGLRTMPVRGAGEVLVGALSSKVLAPGVDGNPSLAQGTEPILDQYREKPELSHQRYLLVMTWVHASQIFKAIGQDSRFEGLMISSSVVPGISKEERVDGWGKPYCILADPQRTTVLSGGGIVELDCEALRKTAEQAAEKSIDSRLTKDGDLLVAVYKQRGDLSPSME